MKSQMLLYLLRQTWSNPVFNDSYPPAVFSQAAAVIHQVQAIHECFVATLRPILATGMPHASEAEVEKVISQIAPKTTAFCVAISVGEITDLKRLSAAAVAIAISYWADQSMDRGDEAMVVAVRRATASGHHGSLPGTRPLSWSIQARFAALRCIEREVRRLTEDPDDLPYVLRAIYRDVLENQALMRDLRRSYAVQTDGHGFWVDQAETVARLAIADSGLMSAVTVIYAIYRHHHPDLPSLAEIYDHPEIASLVQGPCNAAVRVFDDFGDRQIDEGQHPQWGIFNINLFNQSNPQWVRAFVRNSGITDEAEHTALLAALVQNDLVGQSYVTQTYVKLLRSRFASLPQSLWEDYGVFLKLCKRTLEAGFVNSVGDIALADTDTDDSAQPGPLETMVFYEPHIQN